MATTFGPYTPVRRAGDLLFVSGQVGVDPDTKTAVADVSAQTEQVLKNLQRLLGEQGAAMDDVIKTTIFLADIGDFPAVNQVYEQWFNAPRPARSCIAAKALPKVGGEVTLLIEIEAVAYKAAPHE